MGQQQPFNNASTFKLACTKRSSFEPFFFFFWIQMNSLDTEDAYFQTDRGGERKIKCIFSRIKEISL